MIPCLWFTSDPDCKREIVDNKPTCTLGCYEPGAEERLSQKIEEINQSIDDKIEAYLNEGW